MSGDERDGGEPDGTDRDEQQHRVTLLEIIATTISGLLIACLVGVLVWDAAHPDTAAQLSVEVGASQSDASGYRLPATVRNRGDVSARDVVVHLELVSTASDSTIDESEITIDWLPRQSSREIVGVFSRPSRPERVGLRAEVRGYVVP
jgi:uncharacterized protein (TIGR02588 family)